MNHRDITFQQLYSTRSILPFGSFKVNTGHTIRSPRGALERRFFWSADIYVGMGLLKTLSTKGANGQGVSREEELEAP